MLPLWASEHLQVVGAGVGGATPPVGGTAPWRCAPGCQQPLGMPMYTGTMLFCLCNPYASHIYTVWKTLDIVQGFLCQQKPLLLQMVVLLLRQVCKTREQNEENIFFQISFGNRNESWGEIEQELLCIAFLGFINLEQPHLIQKKTRECIINKH